MSRMFFVFLAFLVAFLSGCSTGGTASPDEPAAGSNRPPAEIVDEAAGEPAPEPQPNPTFGQSFTYEDGLQVTISEPQPYEPTAMYLEFGGESAPAYVAFDVTVVNGTPANYDPALFTTSMQSANAEAAMLYDFEGGLEGAPQTTVLPGRETTFRIGYGVTDPADLVMEVSPSFEHQPVIFTS